MSSPKLSIPLGDPGCRLIHGFLGPPKSATQMASGSVQLFLDYRHTGCMAQLPRLTAA